VWLSTCVVGEVANFGQVLYDVRGIYSWICSFVWLFSCAGREVSKIGQEPPLVGQPHSLFFDVV
jgi:hypothetical protein